MIVREWTARATPDGAAGYERHFRAAVLPELEATPGHLGSYLLNRPADNETVVVTVLTLWTSMAAVSGFAGPTPELAVVEPGARAVLLDFDERVTHHDVVHTTVDG